jgi:hypothetical protein
MTKARFGWVVLCALAVVTLSCRAPSPDWTGTWKLDPTKSSFPGAVVSISISANGEYRYDDGIAKFTFRCDGKYRAIGKGRTEVCVKSSASSLDLIRRVNGVKTNASQWELSDSGKILTATATVFHPSGTSITHQVVTSRISGSNGFAGRWMDLSYLQRYANMTVTVDSHAVHIGYPSVGQQIDAPLDGADAVVRGPHVLEGSTFAVRPAGRREFRTVAKRQGKLFSQGTLELSNDGRAITDSWWNPSRPTDKGTLVYERE